MSSITDKRTELDNKLAALFEGKTIAKVKGRFLEFGLTLLLTDGTKVEIDPGQVYHSEAPKLEFTVNGHYWEEKS